MKRFLLLALSIFSLQSVANDASTFTIPKSGEYDVGILSYSITDNKIVLNTDLDKKIGSCAAYDRDGRLYIDISRSEPRASIWSTAVFDSAVSFLPVRVVLDTGSCHAKYGWRISDLAISANYDEGSRHGVRLQQRNQVETDFTSGEIRENVYGYPIEVNVIGSSNTRIEISREANLSKIEGTVNSLNSGTGARRTSMSMVVPSGYYYRVIGNESKTGTIFK